MASPSTRRDLKALRNLINQADLSLALVPDHHSVASARESLNAALALTKAIALVNPATALGAMGGNVTAKRGPEYFARIAAMRKTRGGGRPRKKP